MAHPRTIPIPATLFPYWRWSSQVDELSREYRQNRPFPHIHLPEFLETEVARAIADEFPADHTDAWTQYKHHNENKLGMAKRELFPPRLRAVADELNSQDFAAWLSALTGIPNLVPDPSLEGGGLHQSGPGGFLNVHTDFSMHHYRKNWRRRVNVIIYLNPNWKQQWGGALEFWQKDMKQCGATYPPLLNHAVIFTTDERSLHGFPDPLRCPHGVARKSLAFYYYTVEAQANLHPHSTDYRSRPSDSLKERAFIWLDKKAVDLYSRAKARLGFSDEFASKVLGLISGRK
jgi:Rps23 Pro-64 3,4-dihydroxylase Tpa1-like proline 4-hydroxylase